MSTVTWVLIALAFVIGAGAGLTILVGMLLFRDDEREDE